MKNSYRLNKENALLSYNNGVLKRCRNRRSTVLPSSKCTPQTKRKAVGCPQQSAAFLMFIIQINYFDK